ncbi:MAG: cytochrome c-type biogenesis protein [Acidimicrobiia bacterium]
MKRWAPWVALAVVVAAVLGFAALDSDGPESVDVRERRLSAELRCEECLGLSVADSNAPTSEAIRADIRRRIAAGQSDRDIRRAYVDRYGEDILLSPPSTGVSLFVWLIPIAAVLVAVVGLGFAFRRWRHGPWRTATDADRAIVDELRGSS